jgi:DNA repair protein RadC
MKDTKDTTTSEQLTLFKLGKEPLPKTRKFDYVQDSINEYIQSQDLSNLTSQHVCAMILEVSGIKDAHERSIDVMNQFHSLTPFLNADIKTIGNITKCHNSKKLATLKLFRDVSVFVAREKILHADCVSSLSDVLSYLQLKYKGMKKEEFRVLFLNNKNMIQSDECISCGTVNEAKIYIRELMERCFFHGSSALMLVHNHPSGTMKPSQDDLQITRKIKQAMDYCNIRVLDHVIVGDNAYFSFAEENLL